MSVRRISFDTILMVELLWWFLELTCFLKSFTHFFVSAFVSLEAKLRCNLSKSSSAMVKSNRLVGGRLLPLLRERLEDLVILHRLTAWTFSDWASTRNGTKVFVYVPRWLSGVKGRLDNILQCSILLLHQRCLWSMKSSFSNFLILYTPYRHVVHMWLLVMYTCRSTIQHN